MKGRVFMLLAMLLITCSQANADLKTIGKGDAMQLDVSGYPPNIKAAYDIMKVRCIKCHTLERTIVALRTGIAPISGLLFNRTATKAYGIKMIRKPDSNMSLSEIKTVVGLMNFFLDEAAK